MGYEGGGQHLKIREEIAIKRPANMRVEALTPFGVGAVVAANGPRLAIYEPSENTFYRGASTANTLSRFARIPLPPTQAINVLMGLLPDDKADFSSPQSVRTEGDLVIATYALPDATVDELGFSGGELRMVRAGGKSGRPAYEVHYDDYRDIGGLQFAHKLEASFLNTGTHLTVKIQYRDRKSHPRRFAVRFGASEQGETDRPGRAGFDGRQWLAAQRTL